MATGRPSAGRRSRCWRFSNISGEFSRQTLLVVDDSSTARKALGRQLEAAEVRQVCVLFSDVRGFTQLSQELEPQLLSVKGVKVPVPAFILTPGKKGGMVAPVNEVEA